MDTNSAADTSDCAHPRGVPVETPAARAEDDKHDDVRELFEDDDGRERQPPSQHAAREVRDPPCKRRGEREEDGGHRSILEAPRPLSASPSGPPRSLSRMIAPTRIDLLELDIDLRLTDLWREAADVTEWNLEVVSAFMRAAYGKGYCDALTEDSPGSLCEDHGYRIPARQPGQPSQTDNVSEFRAA